MSVLSPPLSRRSKTSTTGQLPHWSEVSSGPLRPRRSAIDRGLGTTSDDDERYAIDVADDA
jgi:hypothetical protein